MVLKMSVMSQAGKFGVGSIGWDGGGESGGEPIPEPATTLLVGAGIFLAALYAKRRAM
jgi:hypothetical protein